MRTLVLDQHLKVFQLHLEFFDLLVRTTGFFLLCLCLHWNLLYTFFIGQRFDLSPQIYILIADFLELFFELLDLYLILFSLLDSQLFLKLDIIKISLNFEELVFELVANTGLLLLHLPFHRCCLGLLSLQLLLYYNYFLC